MHACLCAHVYKLNNTPSSNCRMPPYSLIPEIEQNVINLSHLRRAKETITSKTETLVPSGLCFASVPNTPEDRALEAAAKKLEGPFYQPGQN